MIRPSASSIVFASSNPHKLAEIREILGPVGVRVESLEEAALESWPEPVEDGASFEENARIKARHYARLAGRRCLADDSGLEVDALSGDPGVLSARYAGACGTRAERDHANNEKLLAAVSGLPSERRTARFACAMCLADPDGTIIAESRGTFEGVIADGPRGTNGFGYDPLLVVPELGRTVAELDSAEKNARSHRGAAARALAGLLSGH